MSVDPDHKILYIRLTRLNGVSNATGYVYKFGPDGYDLSSVTRRLQIVDQGWGTRTVLLNIDMLEHDKWLGHGDHNPLSSFYAY